MQTADDPVVLPDDPSIGPEVQVDYPGYRSTRWRAPNRPLVTQSNDCYVDVNGLMYVTDSNGGLNILEFTGL